MKKVVFSLVVALAVVFSLVTVKAQNQASIAEPNFGASSVSSLSILEPEF
ncbi:hypothetical protein [Tumebacillus amylolyticus]|nr:hypothetical protein [Tumebacillus amylolyticus]